jgi:serine-type D-Ala-D-Ala carboxypeptidase/endopeptidase
MNRRTFILSSCASLLVLNRAGAQTSNLSEAAILDILRHRIDVKKYATGMAVGIIKNGHRSVIVYGKLDAGDARPVAENTLFEIGSVTKVFTALLLADMVYRHELKLDDPVDLYLPDAVVTPQRNGRVITLADLATHTSGLPSFPFSPISTPNPLEALAHFTMSDLRSWLESLKLSRDPGTLWEYSNVGYCLLGLALANKAGITYEKLLNHRIIEPLKLKDTTLHPSANAIHRLAIGHDAKLVPIPPIDLGIFAPAGALRSTVKDMLSFLNTVLPNSHSPVEESAQVLMSIHRPASEVGGEQALGWDVVSGTDPFLAKDGVTEGQAATIVLDVMRRTGVVVLSNAFPVNLGPPPGGGVGAADLARHLIRPKLPLG